MSSSISRLIAAIVREQVGRDGAEAESWRLAALAARDEYSEISDALRQETRLSLALTEQRDEAQAEVERLRDVLIDLRSDMRELAERDHPIARVVYERMCEELGSDTHRDPESPIPPPLAQTSAPGEDGMVTVRGDGIEGALVSVFNERTGNGVIGIVDDAGRFEVCLAAKNGDLVLVWQRMCEELGSK